MAIKKSPTENKDERRKRKLLAGVGLTAVLGGAVMLGRGDEVAPLQLPSATSNADPNPSNPLAGRGVTDEPRIEIQVAREKASPDGTAQEKESAIVNPMVLIDVNQDQLNRYCLFTEVQGDKLLIKAAPWVFSGTKPQNARVDSWDPFAPLKRDTPPELMSDLLKEWKDTYRRSDYSSSYFPDQYQRKVVAESPVWQVDKSPSNAIILAEAPRDAQVVVSLKLEEKTVEHKLISQMKNDAQQLLDRVDEQLKRAGSMAQFLGEALIDPEHHQPSYQAKEVIDRITALQPEDREKLAQAIRGDNITSATRILLNRGDDVGMDDALFHQLLQYSLQSTDAQHALAALIQAKMEDSYSGLEMAEGSQFFEQKKLLKELLTEEQFNKLSSLNDGIFNALVNYLFEEKGRRSYQGFQVKLEELYNPKPDKDGNEPEGFYIPSHTWQALKKHVNKREFTGAGGAISWFDVVDRCDNPMSMCALLEHRSQLQSIVNDGKMGGRGQVVRNNAGNILFETSLFPISSDQDIRASYDNEKDKTISFEEYRQDSIESLTRYNNGKFVMLSDLVHLARNPVSIQPEYKDAVTASDMANDFFMSGPWNGAAISPVQVFGEVYNFSQVPISKLRQRIEVDSQQPQSRIEHSIVQGIDVYQIPPDPVLPKPFTERVAESSSSQTESKSR